MSYYRLNNHHTDLLTGPTVLLPDGTYLTEANHTEYTYPVQDWWWFDNDVAAYTALLPDMVPALQAQVATLIAALTDAQSLEEIRDAAAAAGGN